MCIQWHIHTVCVYEVYLTWFIILHGPFLPWKPLIYGVHINGDEYLCSQNICICYYLSPLAEFQSVKKNVQGEWILMQASVCFNVVTLAYRSLYTWHLKKLRIYLSLRTTFCLYLETSPLSGLTEVAVVWDQVNPIARVIFRYSFFLNIFHEPLWSMCTYSEV